MLYAKLGLNVIRMLKIIYLALLRHISNKITMLRNPISKS